MLEDGVLKFILNNWCMGEGCGGFEIKTRNLFVKTTF